jgi:hypothetical protein
MTLSDRLQEALRLIRAAVVEAAADVRQGPQNPKIGTSSQSPRAFVLDSREIFRTGVWTPEYHDWGWQYQRAAEMLEKQQFSKIKDLLRQGHLYSGHARISFAPEVVARLRSIVGDLPDSNEAAAPDDLIAPAAALRAALPPGSEAATALNAASPARG